MSQKWFVKSSVADKFQQLVLDKDLNSSYIVEGDVATGKSLLATWKASQFTNAGKDVLMLVLTPLQKRFLEDQFVSSSSPSELKDILVMHYSEWVDNGSPTADYMIIDGAEDFDFSKLDTIRSKVNKHWILFLDMQQQLCQDDENSDYLTEIAEFQNKYELPIYKLNVNHRHRKGINCISKNLIPTHHFYCEEIKNYKNRPKVIQRNTYKDQLNYIQSIIQSKKIQNVGILLPSIHSVEKAYQYFQGKGFETEIIEDKNGCVDFKSETPKLLSYQNSKNLEFATIFLPEFSIPTNDRLNEVLPIYKDYYIAFTRGKGEIYILHSNEKFTTGSIDPHMFKFKRDNNYQINVEGRYLLREPDPMDRHLSPFELRD